MKSKRSRLEIIHDIIVTIRDSNPSSKSSKGLIKPTHLLYKSNLSHQMMNDYLVVLIAAGLVREVNIGRVIKVYSVCSKAHSYLKDYKVVQDFIDKYPVNKE